MDSRSTETFSVNASMALASRSCSVPQRASPPCRGDLSETFQRRFSLCPTVKSGNQSGSGETATPLFRETIAECRLVGQR